MDIDERYEQQIAKLRPYMKGACLEHLEANYPKFVQDGKVCGVGYPPWSLGGARCGYENDVNSGMNWNRQMDRSLEQNKVPVNPFAMVLVDADDNQIGEVPVQPTAMYCVSNYVKTIYGPDWASRDRGGKKTVHFGPSETTQLGPLGAVAMYACTGLILDIKYTEACKETGESVDVNHGIDDCSLANLLRVLEFLGMGELYKRIINECVDTIGKNMPPKRAVGHVVGAIVTAQQIDEPLLLQQAIGVINKSIGSLNCVIPGACVFSSGTWESLIKGTKEVFMLSASAYLVYMILNDRDEEEMNDIIMESRDKFFGKHGTIAGPNKNTLLSTLKSANTLVCLSGCFGTESSLPNNIKICVLFPVAGGLNIIQKNMINMVTMFDFYIVGAIVHSGDASVYSDTPKWVTDVVDVMLGVDKVFEDIEEETLKKIKEIIYPPITGGNEHCDLVYIQYVAIMRGATGRKGTIANFENKELASRLSAFAIVQGLALFAETGIVHGVTLSRPMRKKRPLHAPSQAVAAPPPHH